MLVSSGRLPAHQNPQAPPQENTALDLPTPDQVPGPAPIFPSSECPDSQTPQTFPQVSVAPPPPPAQRAPGRVPSTPCSPGPPSNPTGPAPGPLVAAAAVGTVLRPAQRPSPQSPLTGTACSPSRADGHGLHSTYRRGYGTAIFPGSTSRPRSAAVSRRLLGQQRLRPRPTTDIICIHTLIVSQQPPELYFVKEHFLNFSE